METCNIEKISADVVEIKQDIREIKDDVREHMSRTAANEARIEIMEEFVKASSVQAQDNFKAMLQSNKDNQDALNKQIKLLLGVFTGMAALAGAFVALFQYLN